MESAHSREVAHVVSQNLKSDSGSLDKDALRRKEIKYQSQNATTILGKDLQQYTYIPEDTGNIEVSRPESDKLIPAGGSAFSPVKQRRSIEEAEVSSTTTDHRGKRSFDESSNPVSTRHQPEFHQRQRRQNRPHQVTETAAASSTTSFDDEEHLHMQATSGRGRKGGNEVRPPSCGTPLGKIKEEQASSTTTDVDLGYEKVTHQKQTSKQNDGEFLKPDPPSQTSVSSSQTFLFGSSQNADDKRTNHPHGAHFPGGSQTRDGRFPFDPRHMPMLTGQGVGGSPILSDISLIPLSPQPMTGIGGANPFNQSAPFDFYMGGFASPTMSMLSQARNLSPRHSMQDLEKMNYPFCGNSSNMVPTVPGSQGPMTSLPGSFSTQGLSPLAYYQLMQQQQRLLASSLEKQDELGRFPSPLCRSRARKRPLSISPAFSDNLDITAMIRTSPNSLLPFVNGGLNQSRSSSVASGGSYGHLAAGGISPSGYLSGYNTPMMTSPQQLQLLTRQMAFPGHMGSGIPTNHMATTMDKTQSGIPNPFHPMGNSSMGFLPHHGAHLPGKNHPSLSNMMPPNRNELKSGNKLSTERASPSVNFNNNNNIGVSPGSHVTNDDNDVVYETNCDWENCTMEFDTQEQLVQHISNDHIHGDKKEFVCRWKNCARDQRPFKAQYMLVVHMRRHTGEKPHKCNFKGCTKAYSRLENLKTHLRSHTGEKPYVCEYPQCTKAFSNASDRAKHQNRTHSNEKPYACKISGCTKRYTDPSSLRKHVKTVHGPEAHVTKRMKANREREEKQSEINVKQEPGVEKDKRKSENESSKQNCHPLARTTGPQSNDTNPSNNMNPRSNQSSYTSGSDMTPQNSPHMTSQNNDSGVDVNVGGNDGDSDGDIVVDENPLPDSTSGGGVGLHVRRRCQLKSSLIQRHVSKKMATLSIGGGIGDHAMGDYPARTVEGSNNAINEKLIKKGLLGGGTTEVSSTVKGKIIPLKAGGSAASRRQMALINQERRDSGTVSDVSRKSSMASQSSRRSSQMSNNGINVAGSYDPISLDSSRRSSNNSAVAGPRQSISNAPAINPYDLHRLRSEFNEKAGLPPPTPISGESYSKHQMSRWLKENEQYRGPSGQGGRCQHSGPFQPTPPQMGPPQPPCDPTIRRASDGAYMRSKTSQQSGAVPGQISRRASDPVRKASQVDPNKLPTVQRYSSWNNMSPLPGIKNVTQNQNYHGNATSENSMQMQDPNSSNSSFFGNESGYHGHGSNMNLHHHQASHQAHFHQQPYPSHGGMNERVLIDNLNADMATGVQLGMENITNQPNYGNVMSPATNVMSPAANVMSPAANVMSPAANVMSPAANIMSPHSNVMSPHTNSDLNQQRVTAQGGYSSISTPRSFQNTVNPMGYPTSQPIRGRQVMNTQQREQYQSNVPLNPNMMYSNPQMNSNMMAQQAGMIQHQSSHSHMNRHYAPYTNSPEMYNMYNQQMMGDHAQMLQRQAMQNQINSPATRNHPSTSVNHPANQPASYLGNHNGQAEHLSTPRPPSHSSASQQNRMRLARVRQADAISAMTSQAMTSPNVINPPPLQTGSGNRVNCTPDAQIPDAFLQQEFIDSIPELQPELMNNNNCNETPSFVKMAADSTTGPDGDNGAAEDNDDAISMTNTDVTLPPMSAFSSRLATPLLNKPFPPQHPLAGSQHPASNMAINNMSSMLSTLEEENKYFSIFPPQ